MLVSRPSIEVGLILEKQSNHDLDAKRFLEDFEDFLAPRLDIYEQVIYLYVLRHSRLVGKSEVTIGFKSRRIKMGFGIGVKGKPMAEATCYEKLRSLQAKGYLEILDVVQDGTKLRLRLPSEIPGLIPPLVTKAEPDLDEVDFFSVPENRLRILRREGNQCFYCLKAIDSSNYVIEHVLSRPSGEN